MEGHRLRNVEQQANHSCVPNQIIARVHSSIRHASEEVGHKKSNLGAG